MSYVENSLETDDGKQYTDSWRKFLGPYKQFIVPTYGALDWGKPQFSAILISFISIIFSLIWYMEPSILTTFSIVGIVLFSLDCCLPSITKLLFSSRKWNELDEHNFNSVLVHFANGETRLYNAYANLYNLRLNQPKVFSVVMLMAFALLAWIGSMIDNLLLTYLLVIVLVSAPGLSRYGLMANATRLLKGLLKKVPVKGKKNL